MGHYLVQGTVRRTEYESDDAPTETEETRLVRAASETQAREKFEHHFESQSSDYGIDYRVLTCVAHDEIV